MSLEDTIRKATCRVDKKGNQLGSAFWVADQKLVTAAHVTEVSPDNKVEIRTIDGEVIECSVEYSNIHNENDPGTDLAILESEDTPKDYEILSVDQTVPSIGAEVVWSGYARLFGEDKMERQRFGWGNVASNVYGEETAEFFEVDGLFNPSHSGGPVVSIENNKVVGVVSASAGGFGNLEDAWQKRSQLMSKALDIYEQATGNSGFRSEFESTDPVAAAQIQHLFDQIGVNYEVNTDDGTTKVKFYRAELPGRASLLLSEMAQLLMDTARSTFQMGVGIATGGKPLVNLI